MSEQFEHKDSLPAASGEQDLAVLINRLQKQLVSLEKKIDSLLNQPSERPFREKRFSRPFRSFARAEDNAAGGRGFDRGGHFRKRHDEENRGFAYKKKDYGDSREGGFSQDRNFSRRGESRNEGAEPRNKPFHYKQKRRG